MHVRCLCTPLWGRFKPLRPLTLALLTVCAVGFYAARPSGAHALGGPSNLAPPVIGGNLVEGGRLTAHPGTWSGLPALSYSYEWQRCSNPDPSSCAATGVAGTAYALTPADSGSWLRITVSVVNSDGLAKASSELAGPVTTAPLNPAIASRNISWPVISGEPRVGNLLDASEGLWYAPPDASFRFQWRRCGNDGCVEIAGAVAPYYVPTYSDQGAQLEVVVMPVSVTPLLPAIGPVASELTPSAICDSPEGSTTCGPSPCEPPYYKPGAASVTLLPPVAVQPDRVTLTWTGSGGQYFRAYEIHRSLNPSFEPGPTTLLARFEDQTASSYTDANVARETAYSYKVVLVTTCAELQSDEQRVQFPGQGYTTRNVYGPAATQATYIRASASDQTSQCVNSGAEGTLLVGADSQTVYRSLLRLDLSQIPANAQITDARLVLWSRSAATADLTVSALVRDWQEGTGAGTCAGDGATWQQARTGSPWSSPGGDVDPDTWGSGEGQHDPYQPSRIEVSITGLVRTWVAGGKPNYGLMLRATKETSAPGVFAFLSDETASASQTPVLAVRYTVVTTTEQEYNPDSRPYEPTGGTPSICSNSDVRTQQGLAPVPANDPSAHIITACLSQSAKAIEFRNDDGRWTINLECDGPVGNGSTVGPGYIAKFVDDRRGGVQRLFADGRAMVALAAYPHIADIGGLGIFGYHAARGEPNKTAASTDPADPAIEARGADQFRQLEGAYCAKIGAPNGLWGVSGSTVLNQDGSGTCPQSTWYTTCPYFKTGTTGKGVGKLDIAVTLRDPWQDDVMRVVYRWRFRSEGVKMWAYVEPRGRTIAIWEDPLHPGTYKTGVPFAKEPKFVVGLRGSSTPSGPLFNRVVEFTGNTVKGFSYAAARGSALEAANVGTDYLNADNRNRVRWDFPNWTNSSPGFGQPFPNSARLRQHEPCPLKTAPVTTPACFTVVMRAYNPDSIRSGSLGQPSTNWESGNAAGTGVGLDQWAYDASVQQPAYPKDTKTTPSQNPECIIFPYAQPPTDPALPDLRRWEVAGRKDVSGLVGLNQQKDNPRFFGVSASMFHAWVGGRGPTDCEPLLRALPTESRAQAAPSCKFRVGGVCRYGVFASFGLNNGYPPQLRGQDEDYAEESALPSPY